MKQQNQGIMEQDNSANTLRGRIRGVIDKRPKTFGAGYHMPLELDTRLCVEDGVKSLSHVLPVDEAVLDSLIERGGAVKKTKEELIDTIGFTPEWYAKKIEEYVQYKNQKSNLVTKIANRNSNVFDKTLSEESAKDSVDLNIVDTILTIHSDSLNDRVIRNYIIARGYVWTDKGYYVGLATKVFGQNKQ